MLDNKQLAIVESDSTIYLWDLENNKLERHPTPKEISLQGVGFTPDGKLMIATTVKEEESVCLSELLDQRFQELAKCLKTPNENALIPGRVTFSPDGKRAAISYLAGDDVYTPKTLEIGAADAVGMVVAVPWHISAQSDQSKFVTTSKSLWGNVDVNWRTVMSYDATMALIEGLKKAPTRDGLVKALRSPKFTVKGATGEVKFTSGDRHRDPDQSDDEIQLVKIKASDPQSSSGFHYEFIGASID